MRQRRPDMSEVKDSRPAVDEEHCMNPWNGVCRSRDILLYIYYGGRRLPICRRCWMEIASSDVEWSYDQND